MDTGRVVDVSGRTRSGRVSFGSGYLIGPGLVLTAGHVVVGEDGAPLEGLRVRFLNDGRPWACELAWSGSGGVDAALLRIVEKGAPACEPVRWGQLVATKVGIACEAVGFPKAMEQPGGLRDTEHLSGTINTGTGLLGGRVHLTATSAPPRDGVWVGMSERRCSAARC
ncbi:serine protease [Microtetraspora fusca]|uniref:Serine protease n=1 Tax=Microtetraspora fusca TaxID=1997 RepID=A0ABW6VJH6_MICFU